MGSVKDLVVLNKAQSERPGEGHFIFSDRYSVFDWGEMPDHIENKGKSLCMTSAYFFEKLETLGIKTHYLGLVENSSQKKFTQCNTPVNILKVKLVRVLKPTMNNNQYDYTIYQKEKSNYLIPLEVIYRNSLPAGSSIFKRLKEGSIKPEDIGLNSIPVPGQKLDKPILDVSTKLESTDRYLSWKEAQSISGLTEVEIKNIQKTCLLINDLITGEAGKLGLINEDGKFEFAFDEQRNLMLVDVLGTPDECRFTFDSIPVSKEAARIHYRKTDWFKDIEDAKKKDRVNWKEEVKTNPPKLPEKMAKLISGLYQGFCNEITNKSWFNVPPFKTILSELKASLGI